jgi:RNA recognition motif-containing protein
MGSKIIYLHNKPQVCAVFGKKSSMEEACKISLFEDNDFHLEPIQNRGDEEVRDKTVVVRDLPLDVDRLTLKKIMEKVGTVTDIKLQISGMWYKAYVTYDNKATVDSQFKNRWSLFYLKDLCRVAPATATRQEIEERNRNTLKLAGLPFGTTAYDLSEVLKKVDAKTCFIPRTRNQYGRARYAYVTFDNEEICNKLLNNELAVTINEAILG